MGKRGQKHLAGSDAGSMDEAGDSHEQAQGPELQDPGGSQQRNRRDRRPTHEIRRHADAQPTQPVDHRSARDRSNHDGQHGAECDDSRLRGTSGGLQYEPRHTELGQ